MYNEIPVMDKKETKETYALQIRGILGKDSFWDVHPAEFTSGLIVKPKDTTLIKDNGCGKIEKVYILGVPSRKNREGICGLGIATWDINGTDFYNLLTNSMGYTENPKDGKTLSTFEKTIDTTENLVRELKSLEEAVKQ